MKLSSTILILAISGMTLVSGCTKKNTRSKNAAKPAVQKPAADTPKTTPEPPKNPDTAVQSQPSRTGTPPSTTSSDETKKTEETTSTVTTTVTGSAASTKPAPIPVVPQAAKPAADDTVKKDPVIVYEECTTPTVRKLMVGEKAKTIERITPKALSAVKTDVSRRCEKPKDLTADKAETSLNKVIVEVATEAFPQSKVHIEFFKMAEEKKMPDAERVNVYNDYEASLTSVAFDGDDDGGESDDDTLPLLPEVAKHAPAVTTTTEQPKTATPPQTPNTATPTAPVTTTAAPVVPKLATPAVPVTTATPQTTTKPVATPTPATPVQTPKATVTPVPVKTPEIAHKEKPAAVPAKEDPIEAHKKCVADAVKDLSNSYKPELKKNLTPSIMSTQRGIIAKLCPQISDKDGKMAELTTKVFSDTMKSEFKDAAAAIDFYVATESKKIPEAEKNKLYQSYKPTVAVKDETFEAFKQCLLKEATNLDKQHKDIEKTAMSAAKKKSVKDDVIKACPLPNGKDGKVNPIAKNLSESFIEIKLRQVNREARMYKDEDILAKLELDAKQKQISDAGKNQTPKGSPAAKTPAPQKQDDKTAKNDQPAAPADLKPIEVKDIAAFEICATSRADALIAMFKKGEAEREILKKVEMPAQILQLKMAVLHLCNYADNKDRESVILKVLSQKILSHYPDSKSTLDTYLAIEKKKLNAESKTVLISFYDTAMEVQIKDLKILGKIDPSSKDTQQLVYDVTQMGGIMNVTNVNKITGGHNYPPIQIVKKDEDKIRFHFDFDNKGAGDGTLSISGEMNPHILDLKFIQGDLLTLKAKQATVVQLSIDSWKRALENRIRLGLKLASPEAQTIPLKFEYEFAKPTDARMCELTPQEMKCKDGDVKIKLKFNADLIKAIP